MAFTPEEASSGTTKEFPKIKGGEEGVWALPARISLIVDLGQQERENFEEEYKGDSKQEEALKREKNPAILVERDGKTYFSNPQTPVRQVAIFADLMTEKVDFGEKIGEKPYRIMLNKSFQGNISGTALTVMKSRDKDGKTIEDSPKTFHVRSLLSKLGKACGVNFVKNGNDIRALASQAFAATVENKKAKSGDAVYTNFRDASPLMEGVVVPEMETECQLITFEDATKEQIQFLWSNVIKTIKKSGDYAGSQIEKAIQEYEADKAASSTSAETKTKEEKAEKTSTGGGFDDFDDDIPF